MQVLPTALLILVHVLSWLDRLSVATSTAEVSSQQKCMLHTASATCQHYYRISQLKFHAFIDPRYLDITCRQSHKALNCVDKLLISCPDIYRTPFNMQRSVLKTVCQDRRQEYLKSAKCFSTTSLKGNAIYKCLSMATNEKRLQTEPCNLTREIVSCASEVVHKTVGCTLDDVQLMETLMSNFLSTLCMELSTAPYPLDDGGDGDDDNDDDDDDCGDNNDDGGGDGDDDDVVVGGDADDGGGDDDDNDDDDCGDNNDDGGGDGDDDDDGGGGGSDVDDDDDDDYDDDYDDNNSVLVIKQMLLVS
ncbi:replicase polyprotein 1a [Elysia marginata]|uniref:Replicase polyprotein 1a n=1 Tax=Elysia marginata TaxID=1093978 RepID=A0AAV4FE81_9GAST|nr:replicase polyprotein 1a [Elysia marginata]